MAYLLVLMYTGVTVVRECSGGRGDSPPATLSICLMPTLSTGVLIARSIVREVIASRCHGGKMSRSQKNEKITFLCMTALRNKTVAYTSFSIVRQCKSPSLSRKIFEIQTFCDHGIT